MAHVALPTPLPPPAVRELAQHASARTGIFDAYGFPAAPALSHYCMRRLLDPDGVRTTFDAFASERSLRELADFYQKRLTDRGMTRHPNHTIWQLPAGSPVPRRTLAVTLPAAPGRHQSCPKPPPTTAKTLVVLARIE